MMKLWQFLISHEVKFQPSQPDYGLVVTLKRVYRNGSLAICHISRDHSQTMWTTKGGGGVSKMSTPCPQGGGGPNSDLSMWTKSFQCNVFEFIFGDNL